MSDIDLFLERYSNVFNDEDLINTALTRAAVFITYSTYGEAFYKDALFLQAASFLYSNNESNTKQIASRAVTGEYSVSYVNTFNASTGYFNPYESQLSAIKRQLGFGFGMILEL